MASMTATSHRPVVSTYVERLQAAADKKRAAEMAERLERRRQADAREAEIRSNSELASQLRRTPIEVNQINKDVGESSSSAPRHRKQDMAEIDGRALPTSSGDHSNIDLRPNPMQSLIMSSPATTGEPEYPPPRARNSAR